MSRQTPNLASSSKSRNSSCSPAARFDAAVRSPESGQVTAAERVLASELAGRDDSCGALSMMVGSMLRMVQAGKGSDSSWKAS
ncbi:MAG: hypothetical protein R6W06_04720 [Prochlorococcaceae cyanobacterium]